MKKILILLLLICLVLPVTAPAVSANEQPESASNEGIITPFYDMILAIHGTCYIENGMIVMSGTCSAQGHSGSVSVKVQLQYNNGGGWQNSSSWSASGTGSVTKQATSTPESGTLYRAKITGTVTRNGKSESDTLTTGVCAL